MRFVGDLHTKLLCYYLAQESQCDVSSHYATAQAWRLVPSLSHYAREHKLYSSAPVHLPYAMTACPRLHE